MNWQEYILNAGKEKVDMEDLQIDTIYDTKEDIINNWQIHMLDLIHNKNTNMDELECFNNIKLSLMDNTDKLNSISVQLEDIINKASKL